MLAMICGHDIMPRSLESELFFVVAWGSEVIRIATPVGFDFFADVIGLPLEHVVIVGAVVGLFPESVTIRPSPVTSEHNACWHMSCQNGMAFQFMLAIHVLH